MTKKSFFWITLATGFLLVAASTWYGLRQQETSLLTQRLTECGLPPHGGAQIKLCQQDPPFPRLAGIELANTQDYLDPTLLHRITQLNVVILNFWRDWSYGGHNMEYVVQKIRALAPYLLIGQYTVMDAAYKERRDPANANIAAKLTREGWWLRGLTGHRIQIAKTNHNYQTNFTLFTHPDKKGRRYPQWLAELDYSVFFRNVPFDIWFFDDVEKEEHVPLADWKGNGELMRSDSPLVQHLYRQGQASEWVAARNLDTQAIFIGNTDNNLHYLAYKGKLQGAYLEGLMGYSWSIEQQHGWNAMMHRYHAVFANLAPPGIVIFNVAGSLTDYQFFRFAFTSDLMDNGYFSYTDKKHIYASLPWFDEYNVKLGAPIDPPQFKAWENGVYRRRFQNGMALVNPTNHPETVSVHGYRHFQGHQDPSVNNGEQITHVVLAAHDGLVLLRQ